MPAGNASLDSRLHELYGMAERARAQSQFLARRLRETQHQTQQNWQLIQEAWDRGERIRGLWLADRTGAERLRYSAYARLQARLATMPVIEQAKGIIMAQCGWTEEQAFDALRRASQRSNMRVRDLAAAIVDRTAGSPAGQGQAGPAPAARQARRGSSPARAPRLPRPSSGAGAPHETAG